ncbi:hypothetical protein ABZV78_03520 [Micromonospora sp. NPDC004540]|uniref:hypothetical protein n=1 Tax=Micromonospora sp. NPDC004540 TaxID=3154457 RepID=UPI0033A97CBD
MMLVSTACTLAALLFSGPGHRFGGPVLYFVVLCGSGALLVLSIALLVLRHRIGAGRPVEQAAPSIRHGHPEPPDTAAPSR